MKGFFYLTLSIITEVLATAMLKVSDGFTNLVPTIILIIGYSISFYYLSLCLRSLPLSLAHAIWMGAGTVFTAALGVIFWQEVVTFMKVIGIIMIIGGVVILNLSNQVSKKSVSSS